MQPCPQAPVRTSLHPRRRFQVYCSNAIRHRSHETFCICSAGSAVASSNGEHPLSAFTGGNHARNGREPVAGGDSLPSAADALLADVLEGMGRTPKSLLASISTTHAVRVSSIGLRNWRSIIRPVRSLPSWRRISTRSSLASAPAVYSSNTAAEAA